MYYVHIDNGNGANEMNERQTISWIERNTGAQVTYWDYNRVSKEYTVGVKGLKDELVFVGQYKDLMLVQMLDNLNILH